MSMCYHRLVHHEPLARTEIGISPGNRIAHRRISVPPFYFFARGRHCGLGGSLFRPSDDSRWANQEGRAEWLGERKAELNGPEKGRARRPACRIGGTHMSAIAMASHGYVRS